MPEDLKLSQIGSSPLPPPFRGLHSHGVRKHCQIIFACYFRKSSVISLVCVCVCVCVAGELAPRDDQHPSEPRCWCQPAEWWGRVCSGCRHHLLLPCGELPLQHCWEIHGKAAHLWGEQRASKKGKQCLWSFVLGLFVCLFVCFLLYFFIFYSVYI